jgi:hypothetical protein
MWRSHLPPYAAPMYACSCSMRYISCTAMVGGKHTQRPSALPAALTLYSGMLGEQYRPVEMTT